MGFSINIPDKLEYALELIKHACEDVQESQKG